MGQSNVKRGELVEYRVRILANSVAIDALIDVLARRFERPPFHVPTGEEIVGLRAEVEAEVKRRAEEIKAKARERAKP